MFEAVIRHYVYKSSMYQRVAIISDDPSLCTKGDVVFYLSPKSRHEKIDAVHARAIILASLLNGGT